MAGGSEMNEGDWIEIEPLGKPFLAFVILGIWGIFVFARYRHRRHMTIDRHHWVTYWVVATILAILALYGLEWGNIIN